MDRIRENRIRQLQIEHSSLLSTANNASPRREGEGESSSNHRSAHVHVANRSIPPVALPKCSNLHEILDNLTHTSQNYARQIADLKAQKSIIDKKLLDLQESISEGSASSEE